MALVGRRRHPKRSQLAQSPDPSAGGGDGGGGGLFPDAGPG